MILTKCHQVIWSSQSHTYQTDHLSAIQIRTYLTRCGGLGLASLLAQQAQGIWPSG